MIDPRTTIISLTLGLAAPAIASPVGEAIRAIEEASDASRTEGGRCERTLRHDLAEMIVELRDARRTGPTGQLVRAMRSLARQADDACPRSIARELARVADLLADATDD